VGEAVLESPFRATDPIYMGAPRHPQNLDFTSITKVKNPRFHIDKYGISTYNKHDTYTMVNVGRVNRNSKTRASGLVSWRKLADAKQKEAEEEVLDKVPFANKSRGA